MNLLNRELGMSKKFQEYLLDIKNEKGPILISGLCGVCKSVFLASSSFNIKKPICIITYNEIQAKKILKDLSYFIDNTSYLPKREIVAYDYNAESKDLQYERIEVLNKIHNKKVDVLVLTIETVMQKMISKESIYKNLVNLKLSDEISYDEIKQKLSMLGYEKTQMVETKGQFSTRGDILDIGISNNKGIRIELWGDQIDSIREFSISSQRSIQMLETITIYPAHEFVLEDSLEQVCERIRKRV